MSLNKFEFHFVLEINLNYNFNLNTDWFNCLINIECEIFLKKGSISKLIHEKMSFAMLMRLTWVVLPSSNIFN